MSPLVEFLPRLFVAVAEILLTLAAITLIAVLVIYAAAAVLHVYRWWWR